MSRRVPTRSRLLPFALGLLLALGAAAPDGASAGARPHRFGGDEGNGRVYGADRLRPARTGPPPGRFMRRPDVPEPDTQRPLRPTAAIPDPTPRIRGGSRFARDGKYFYATTSDPALTRKTPKQQYRNLIPSPEVVENTRRKSAATR